MMTTSRTNAFSSFMIISLHYLSRGETRREGERIREREREREVKKGRGSERAKREIERKREKEREERKEKENSLRNCSRDQLTSDMAFDLTTLSIVDHATIFACCAFSLSLSNW